MMRNALFVVTVLAVVAQSGAVTHPGDVQALKEVGFRVALVLPVLALANLILLSSQFH